MALFSQEQLGEIAAAGDALTVTRKLAGAAHGQDVFILSCGPSLSTYSSANLRVLLEGKCVLAVKQAFEYCPEVVDVQMLNTWNSQRYAYDVRRPIIMRERAEGDPPVFGECDVTLPVRRPSDLSDQLARKHNFDDFTLDRTLIRPWGPGVIYELGFYLALHMGAKRIITLGWDVGVRNSAVMPHFYDRPDAGKTQALAAAARLPTLLARNRYLHDAGLLYNKPRIIPDEVETCAQASGPWSDWLASKGVELVVVSNGSIVADRIPRKRLEDFARAA